MSTMLDVHTYYFSPLIREQTIHVMKTTKVLFSECGKSYTPINNREVYLKNAPDNT